MVRQAAGAREGSFAKEIEGCVQTDANEALTLSFVNNVAANGNGPFTIPNNVNGICGINGEILRMRVNDPSGARLFTISVGNPEIGYPWASVKYQPCNCESVHNFSESETFTFTFANSAYQVRVHRDVDSSRKNMYVAILQT